MNLLFCFLVLISCQKQGSGTIDSALTGKWKWLKTSYSGRGVGNYFISPITNNSNHKIVFDKNMISVFKNDSIVYTSTYTIQEPSLSEKKLFFSKEIGTWDYLISNSFYKIFSDTLIIQGGADDRLGNSLFVKIK